MRIITNKFNLDKNKILTENWWTVKTEDGELSTLLDVNNYTEHVQLHM